MPVPVGVGVLRWHSGSCRSWRSTAMSRSAGCGHRILPSGQRHEPPVASTSGLTTVSSRLCRSAMAPVVDAGPPSGSAPIGWSRRGWRGCRRRVRQVADVGVQVVVPLRRLQRAGQRQRSPRKPPRGSRWRAGVARWRRCRPPPLGGLCRTRRHGAGCARVTTMPSAGSAAAAAVVGQDGVADRRGRGGGRPNRSSPQRHWRPAPPAPTPGRLGRTAVGVAPDEQRAGGPLRRRGTRQSPAWWPGCGPSLNARRGSIRDVPGPERHLLVDVVGIGVHRVVRGDQVGHIDEVRRGAGSAGLTTMAQYAPAGAITFSLLPLVLPVKG